MTILAETFDHLVEYDQWAGNRLLTITFKYTGMAKCLTGDRIAGEFRDCIRTHGAERAIATYLRIAACFAWEPMYKPMALVYRQ